MPPLFFNRPNFKRFSFNYKKGSVVVGGFGGTGCFLANLACECLTSFGKPPECVMLGHPDKRIVQSRRSAVSLWYRNRVVSVYANGNLDGMGKSLVVGVRNKGKWSEEVENSIKRMCKKINKKHVSTYIHFSDTGGSGAIMGDELLGKIKALGRFDYIFNCIPQATKDSKLTQANEEEILSNAVKTCTEKTRNFYMRNFTKKLEKDIANVASICGIALGTLGGEIEDYEKSDWWRILYPLTEVNCEIDGSGLDGIVKRPNYHLTISASCRAILKHELLKRDTLLLVGNVHPKMLKSIWKDVAGELPKGTSLPEVRQVAPISIKDELYNTVAVRFRRMGYIPLDTPIFDKAHEIDKVK